MKMIFEDKAASFIVAKNVLSSVRAGEPVTIVQVYKNERRLEFMGGKQGHLCFIDKKGGCNSATVGGIEEFLKRMISDPDSTVDYHIFFSSQELIDFVKAF